MRPTQEAAFSNHYTLRMSKTVLPDARVSPRFAGVATFCRYPRLADVLPENRPADWAIYGVPYDAGVTYRPGARFGPRAVREESQYVKRFHMPYGVDVCDVLSIADAGDSPIEPYSCEKNAATQYAFARGLGDAMRTKLLAVGGDHSIALANLRATHERLGGKSAGLAVIHFDSHLDTVDAVWDEKWGHASVFRRAIEMGLIDPKAMISLGVKGPLNRADDLEYAASAGITVVSREALTGDGERVVRDYRARIGDRPVYITFDIDVVDPAFAPGTGTPSVGGLTSSEALNLLRTFRGCNVVGGDVVEVLPDRDPGGITALLAAHVMFEILAIDADRRRR